MENMNPRELLILAIQIEENGYAYYSRMTERTDNAGAKEIFRYLAAQEKQHIVDFKTIAQNLGPSGDVLPAVYQVPEIQGYLAALADGRVFPSLMNGEAAKKAAAEIDSDIDAIAYAIVFEKDAILFFGEVLEMLSKDHPERGAILELIHQEKLHISRLHVLAGQIKGGA
ncbi:MAG: ferritin family protein [Candidatus Ozemobacteraceae bacterium]